MAVLVVAPTILTSDQTEYKRLIQAYSVFAKRVQIDVSDGTLPGSAITLPETELSWPSGWITDLHMMVVRPSEHLPAIIKLKPHLVIFHSEVQEDLLQVFAALQKNEIKAGIAIMKSTYPGTIKNLIAAADHAMIFSGNLGQNGGEADLLQLEKIRIIKMIKSSIEIGWDGGANQRNIRTIAQAGVNIINVGSALASAQDPKAAYDALVLEADNPGIL